MPSGSWSYEQMGAFGVIGNILHALVLDKSHITIGKVGASETQANSTCHTLASTTAQCNTK